MRFTLPVNAAATAGNLSALAAVQASPADDDVKMWTAIVLGTVQGILALLAHTKNPRNGFNATEPDDPPKRRKSRRKARPVPPGGGS